MGVARFACAVVAWVFTVLATACALPDRRISYLEMAPRLEYVGFSLERPPNAHWYARTGMQSPTRAHLRRDTGSKTHTMYVEVSLFRLDPVPNTFEEFWQLVADVPQRAGYSVERLWSHPQRADLQGAWCVRVDEAYAVRGSPVAPDRELRMEIHSARCRHPSAPHLGISLLSSQRGLPGELDPALDREGEWILERVRIDAIPEPAPLR